MTTFNFTISFGIEDNKAEDRVVYVDREHGRYVTYHSDGRMTFSWLEPSGVDPEFLASFPGLD